MFVVRKKIELIKMSKDKLSKTATRTPPLTLTHLPTPAKADTDPKKDMIEQMMIMLQQMKTDSKENVREIKQEIKESEQRLSGRLDRTEQKIDKLQQQISENTEELEAARKEREEMKEEFHNIEAKVDTLREDYQDVETKQSDMTLVMLRQEMEKSFYKIRLQNFPDTSPQSESTFELIIDWLAKETQIPAVTLREGTDVIYRMGGQVARKFNRPREIMICFLRRRLRDQILEILEQKERYVDNNKLLILREVPFEIRQRRKPYKELAALLRKKEVKYRWIIPQGLNFYFAGRRQNITSIHKMEQFREKYREDFQQKGTYDGERQKEQSDVRVPQRQQIQQQDPEKEQELSQQSSEREEDSQDTSDPELKGAAAPKPRRTTRKQKGKI